MRKRNSNWLKIYLQNCRLLNKSDRTIQNYRADLTAFITWYESRYGRDMAKVNAEHIGEYQSFLTYGGFTAPKIGLWDKLKSFFKKKTRVLNTGQYRPPLSVNSRRRHLSSLKNFFDYLKQTHEDRSKLFRINPVKPKVHGILVKDININHTKYLKPSDWEKIFEKTWRTKERLALYLLYFGGLRLHELCTLRKEFFDRKSGTITFPRKGGKVHTLKIKKADEIFDQMEYWFTNRSFQSTYLFTGRKGQPLSPRAMSTLIKKMIKRAGVGDHITPHSFRKSCATNLYLSTRDLLYVRDYLGHSDAAVTQTYIDKNALHERHLTM